MLKSIHKIKARKRTYRAQSTFEFTFTFVATMLMLLGTIRIFIWAGRDLVERGRAHNAYIYQDIGGGSLEPLNQTRPVFFFSSEINRIAINSALFGENND